MAKGYILVRLFKVKEALPKTDAKLKITNAENGNVIYENNDAFDISGRSEIIEVTTPEKSLSQKPYEEGVIPYGLYNIDILAKGFKEVIVEGVSVFEENTSIQNIEVIEENEISEFNVSPEKIVIPPEQLVLKAPRDKQMGTMVQPFVLDKPYIPEFIVVHLGSPSSAAENVTVGFVDYIKNVASSEIYPTWPEESLKANIYCQISFALNRIYTEWYRNKGYSFQITNSTAYDQYFIKGRNIFENISKIVDEIFSKYIITVGNKTPFFAQYCNGTTVKCDGLSQWGSVDLANAGMEALDIIQYYFGYDKTLVRATTIEGIPESYPGTALRLNDENNNVKVIQKQLNRISKNFPAIPKIPSEDGKFDKQTEDAVKMFQKVFNLTQDGIVGRATWYRISSIYVGVKRLAELEQEPEYNEEKPSGYVQPDFDGQYPGYVLRECLVGEDVKWLQTYLQAIAKRYKQIPSICVDGVFNKKTKSSVMIFQKIFGLDVNGRIGVNDWGKLILVYTSLDSVENVNKSDILYEYPGFDLGFGDQDGYVMVLQDYINVIAKNNCRISEIPRTGKFDNDTKIAVEKLQKQLGLKVTGVVDEITWNKISSTYEALYSGRKIREK
ncbi:peptidoglycan-binding domain-containing protein [Clostridium uliginosum]|uniref:Peptidoglycan-binding (PGRP) domain of peptidoglycan hydrolases-containing protein n=1 Tax=Clostridium uliginosum TaxID=119641 RepID=A0A1I1QE32_9CLOT|nr:peptidoglycan-binding protein [Clostridium uliginosum]SFD20285.1 Peptidoglycan-binding (PGRP) domain of peptidoglycan hydrolases-containing protein [Clostridium uliginosum]